MTRDEYFASGPSHERPIFDAIMRRLERAGPIHPEFVSVGVFLKNPRKVAELRPMQRWVAVSFSLSRRADHRTITRKVMPYGGRYYHVANVANPDDVDDALAELLIEAYEEASR